MTMYDDTHETARTQVRPEPRHPLRARRFGRRGETTLLFLNYFAANDVHRALA